MTKDTLTELMIDQAILQSMGWGDLIPAYSEQCRCNLELEDSAELLSIANSYSIEDAEGIVIK